MKLQKLAIFTALVIGTATFAKADKISISGSDTYTTTGSPTSSFTINFDPLANVGGTSTGIFSGFLGCFQCVTMAPTLSYTQGDAFSPLQLYSIADNGNNASLTLTSINTISDDPNVANDLGFNGNATLVVNGVTYYGTLDLTTQGGGDGSDVTFSATTTASPVPEPASLAMFGTGLLGIVGAMRRKFKV
ncbi:PEP-CTERM sorting domain-containing protein [Granulicella sp. dw_53]|uniref:PEP-CTERM sorting domain-containing protein n=1 Tax=Granulicella sp. dw_53 TaxID=2719792 RepID=UPI001BD531FD|nr:PEP-CTERM sorting domain-containing protein [Granulicella sp. dw_53]